MIAAMRLLRDSEPAKVGEQPDAEPATIPAHTVEPWTVVRGGVIKGGVMLTFARGEAQQQVAMCCMVEEGNGDQEANAERIVACVNACAGMDPADVKALEQANQNLSAELVKARGLVARTNEALASSNEAATGAMQRNVAGLALARRVRAMLKVAQFEDGMGTVYTHDAESVEEALKAMGALYGSEL